MSEVIKILEAVLDGQMAGSNGMHAIREILKDEKNQRIQSQSSHAFRVCRSLDNIEKGSETWHDFAGNLRQCILFFKRQLKINKIIYDNIVKLADEFGLSIDKSGYEVNAISSFPGWFGYSDDLRQVYELTSRRKDIPVIGDGILYSMSGYKYYASYAQKVIVRASLDMPQGSTLLACLPTGGGKSLIGQLPAYFDTQGGSLGGTIEGAGVTIVIVPTIALAIDQAESSKQYFKNAVNEQHKPMCYYGDMGEEQKKMVREALLNGTVPLLYTSPEAIINGALSDILIDSMRFGKVNRMIIDEAHVVVDWGASFRTEFQLLAAFRRKLMKLGNKGLKTILLSATYTEDAVYILKKLFSEGDNFIEMRADSLRPEPMFRLYNSISIEERQEKILEIIPLIPKPVIIYVTSPKTAREWKGKIIDSGFYSVELFSGETTGNSREDIIERWNNDEIDIMVATSAFGMGVDKRDIRTVIHCCMPESLNRYYQEVGRAGRDGFPCISILSIVPENDYDETFNLINKKVLKADTTAERWESMLSKPYKRLSGDTFWANTDRKRSSLWEQITGQRNAEWNEVVLLFLYRKGFIDILDVEYVAEENRHRVLVRMNKTELLEDTENLMREVKPLRDKDWEVVYSEYANMKELACNFDKSCWAEFFTNTYNYTREKCGGCPYCRKNGDDVYDLDDGLNMEVYGEKILKASPIMVNGMINTVFGQDQELFLSYTGIKDKHMTAEIIKILVDSGVDSIILPSMSEHDWDEIISNIPGMNSSIYSIYNEYELLNNPNFFMTGVVAIFYPDDNDICDRLYKRMKKFLEDNKENKAIYIANEQVHIESQNRLLKNISKVYYKAENLAYNAIEKEQYGLF